MKRLDFRKANFKREATLDFYDDGANFYGYIHESGMPMTYTRYEGKAFISLQVGDLQKLTYDEYRNLPSYELADKYNMVAVEAVDMEDLNNIAWQLMAEYNEAASNIKPVSDEEWKEFVAQAKEVAVDKFNKMDALIKENFDAIVDNFEERKWTIKHIFSYHKRLKEKIERVDNAFNWEDNSRRMYIGRGIASLAEPIEEDWYCKEIQEELNKLKEIKG